MTTPRAASRPPVVLIDMDGVVADLEQGFWAQFALAHPDGPARTDVDTAQFYLSDQMDARWADPIEAILVAPNFFASLPPMPGAAAALNAMVEAGWDVRICTAPKLSNPTCASDKLAWLEEHIGAGWAKRAILAKDKSYVVGDILIDDHPDVSRNITPTWAQVVFDRPYNQDAGSGLRLHSWDQWADTLLPALVGVGALALA